MLWRHRYSVTSYSTKVGQDFVNFGSVVESTSWCHDVMIEDVNHCRLLPTFTPDMQKGFELLSMLSICTWWLLTLLQWQSWPRYWQFWIIVESKWCHDIMIEAVHHHRLLPTSILDIYSVYFTFQCCPYAPGGAHLPCYTGIVDPEVENFGSVVES